AERLLDRGIPLDGLRIFVVDRVVLVELAGSGDVDGVVTRASYGRERIERLPVSVQPVDARAKVRHVNIGEVEGELAELRHRVDACAAPKHGRAIVVEAVGHTESRLHVAKIR